MGLVWHHWRADVFVECYEYTLFMSRIKTQMSPLWKHLLIKGLACHFSALCVAHQWSVFKEQEATHGLATIFFFKWFFPPFNDFTVTCLSGKKITDGNYKKKKRLCLTLSNGNLAAFLPIYQKLKLLKSLLTLRSLEKYQSGFMLKCLCHEFTSMKRGKANHMFLNPSTIQIIVKCLKCLVRFSFPRSVFMIYTIRK